MMLSDRQRFPDGGQAVGTGLASTVGVDFSKVHPPFPTHPLQHRQKLPKSSINTIFSQHSSYQPCGVEVFDKDGLRLVAQLMSRLPVKILATVGKPLVHSRHLRLDLLPVLRPLLFAGRSALQQFQLALHRLEKLRALLEAAIRNRQESLQSQVNANRPTMNRRIGNQHRRLDSHDDIPLRTPYLGQNPHLLDLESVRNGAMQLDRHFPNLR